MQGINALANYKEHFNNMTELTLSHLFQIFTLNPNEPHMHTPMHFQYYIVLCAFLSLTD
jgi:hypothetical protein